MNQAADKVLSEGPQQPRGRRRTDAVREVLETIVFVLVLVIVLKGFLAEWFVIPTGSMATTLLGNHLRVTCPSCSHAAPVNVSQEIDPSDGIPIRVEWWRCENCGLVIPVP